MKRTMRQRVASVRRAARSTAILCLLLVWAAAVAQADVEELKGRLEASFSVIELRNGIFLEPREGSGDLPVVEISDDELWIDGEPATPEGMARLGDQEEIVRELAGELGVDIGAIGTAVAAPTAPVSPEAPEAPEPERETVYKDDQVVVGGNLTIEAHEVAREVVVVGGQLKILGRVNGDAAVFGGHAIIEGEVTGDLAIIGGAANIASTATILGDVATVGGNVTVAEGAEVQGEVNEVAFGPGLRIGKWVEKYAKDATDGDGIRANADIDVTVDPPRRSRNRGSQFAERLFSFLFLCLLGCIALLLARRPIERMASQARVEPAKSALVGLIAQILFVPLLLVLIVVLVVSVIGIPLLVLLPFLLVGIAILVLCGVTASALEVGRFLKQRFGLGMEGVFGLFLLGFAALQLLSLLGGLFSDFGRFFGFFAVMFAVFGWLISYVAMTVGLGAALITRAGLQDGDGGTSGGTSDFSAPTPPAPYGDPGGWTDPVADSQERDASGSDSESYGGYEPGPPPLDPNPGASDPYAETEGDDSVDDGDDPRDR